MKRGEREECEVKIERILEWAEENPKFDTEFVERLQDQLDRAGELSVDQIRALDNILERWRIPE